jgi:hypothetical protein
MRNYQIPSYTITQYGFISRWLFLLLQGRDKRSDWWRQCRKNNRCRQKTKKTKIQLRMIFIPLELSLDFACFKNAWTTTLYYKVKRFEIDTVIWGTLYHCPLKNFVEDRPDKDTEFRYFRSVKELASKL